MKTSVTIRVGICACTPQYLKKLTGNRLLFPDVVFVIKDSRLPNEKNHTASIKRHRCHFFIDERILSRCDLIKSPSGKSERLVESELLSCYVVGRRPGGNFTPLGVVRLIRQQIAKLTPRKREQWLARMA